MRKLELFSLRKSHGKEGLFAGISYSFPDKGLIAIVGDSGSGKTTLLDIVAGLDVGYEGTVLLMGKSLKSLSEKERSILRLREIGYIRQSYDLLESETAFENVCLPLKAASEDSAYLMKEKALSLLATLGLEGKANQVVNTLSGGEKQRVALARALTLDPPILLADEPTGALDQANAEIIYAALASLGKKILVLLVSHDLNRTRKYADVIITLRNGLFVTNPNEEKESEGSLVPATTTRSGKRVPHARPSLPDAIRVLILVPDADTPVMRRSHDREETGPYALGFAMSDVRAVDPRIVALGFRRTLPAVNEYPLQRRDGTEYPVIEASYEIADNTRLVLMQRGGGMRATGSIDPATGLGGPSYSSLIVEDAAAMERFFTGVLDLERRTSREWTVFSPRFRYVTLHAKGAHTGNLGLVEYELADRKPSTGVAPRPPNRGLAAWSFPVRNLDAVLARAAAQRVTRVAGPMKIDDPRFGEVEIATVLAPNGLLVELFERRVPR
jgi:ABC-type lipoprotein export system ATPase subunit/catechol 2,3-dioxygenase-like lactoylglutathione lyase family enzyme